MTLSANNLCGFLYNISYFMITSLETSSTKQITVVLKELMYRFAFIWEHSWQM